MFRERLSLAALVAACTLILGAWVVQAQGRYRRGYSSRNNNVRAYSTRGYSTRG